MGTEEKVLRVVVAPLISGRVVLPGSVVAEVISHHPPESLKNTPAWMLGELEWNGWQVPVISYAGLMDHGCSDPVSAQTRILIFKTLSERAPVPYVGMLIQGLPRLAKLVAESLTEVRSQNCPAGVFRTVLLDEEEAVVPDLDAITQLIESAAYAI